MVLIDLFLYLFIAPIHLLLAGIGSIIGLALRRSRPDLTKNIVKGSWLLMASLMITGFVFTECWGRFVFGRFYEYFDYVPGIDCSPFWLNPQYGTMYHHGMTKHLIFVLWGVYAMLCWGSATGITWWLLTRKSKSKPS